MAAWRIAAAALLLAAAPALALGKEPPPNKALHALFEREFRNGLEEFPELATFLGIDGYDHRLSDLSPAAVARRKARVGKVIAELERFDAKRLSAQDRISRDVMLVDLRVARDEIALYGDLPFASVEGWMPVSPMHGPQRGMSSLVKATTFRRTSDYENYLKRLEAAPKVLEQQVEAMRAGMKSGWMPPQAALQRVPAMFAEFAGTDPAATPMWQPFTKFPAEMGAEERRRWADAGRRVLEQKVHPAFAAYRRFLATEYLPAASKSLAASSLPAGPAYYALRVRAATTTTLTPDEIHAIGLKEVARIRAEMAAVIASTEFMRRVGGASSRSATSRRIPA